MDPSYKRFKRAYTTVLEMVKDRGYRLPSDDITSLTDRLTLARYQALR